MEFEHGNFSKRQAEGYKCYVTRQGLTWDYVPGRDIFSLDIRTEQECKELCTGKPECKGYSWRFDDVLYWCYEFAELDGIHVCEDCYSGTLPTKFSGNCDTDSGNVIDTISTLSAEDCHKVCIETDGCMAYTWFDETTAFKNYCFLYSECSEYKPCAGCNGGSMNCFTPLQCFDYLTLDSERRNENYPGGEDCDCDEADFTSEDWHGEGYYRFLPPAGVGMATKNPGLLHCGTISTLYISDEGNGVMEDMKIGDEVEVKFCGAYYDSCDVDGNIEATKCPEDYYVYKLHLSYYDYVLWLSFTIIHLYTHFFCFQFFYDFFFFFILKIKCKFKKKCLIFVYSAKIYINDKLGLCRILFG